MVIASIKASYVDFKNRIDTILTSNKAPFDKLNEVADEMLPSTKLKLREARVWLAFWNEATMNDQLVKENDERHKIWHQDIIPLIQQINPDLDAENEARLFTALANGLNLQATVHPNRTNILRASQTIHRYIEQLRKSLSD